jgi:ABC-type nitrate/sulfonate/bicarbonate transport system substrate-binding protein
MTTDLPIATDLKAPRPGLFAFNTRWLRKSIGFVGICLAFNINAAEPVEHTLQVISFPGGFNIPLWVAQEQGFFKSRHLNVVLTPTRDSTFQMAGLISGRFDIAVTAFDNVLAYRDGYGESSEVHGEAPITTFMGGDRGFLNLVAVPEARTIEDLRGKILAVDALTTGYSFVLKELLLRGGLNDGDYSMVRAGGVAQRYDKLMKKEVAATLLVSPLELSAKANGFNVLGSASTLLGAYQGVVSAARSQWLTDNRAAASAYISAYADAVSWLYDPKNRRAAADVMMKNMAGLPLAQAEAALSVLIDEQAGIQPRARFEREGAERVLQLRTKFGTSPPLSKNIDRYFDGRLYDAAISN